MKMAAACGISDPCIACIEATFALASLSFMIHFEGVDNKQVRSRLDEAHASFRAREKEREKANDAERAGLESTVMALHLEFIILQDVIDSGESRIVCLHAKDDVHQFGTHNVHNRTSPPFCYRMDSQDPPGILHPTCTCVPCFFPFSVDDTVTSGPQTTQGARMQSTESSLLQPKDTAGTGREETTNAEE